MKRNPQNNDSCLRKLQGMFTEILSQQLEISSWQTFSTPLIFGYGNKNKFFR